LTFATTKTLWFSFLLWDKTKARMTGPNIMGTKRYLLRATITATMASGVFFGGFLDLFSCRKTTPKSTGILEIIFVRENGQKPRQPSHMLTCQSTSD
jgi:hypothetical protein